jgi:nicotinate-nucleotide adenylyltransferase
MRLGLLGGTFDPPHFAHLVLAEEAIAQLKLDRLLFVLTADPPHKQDNEITPISQRVAMLQAAIAGNPAFEFSRLEIDRPGPHYAVDTVRLVKEQHPDAEIVYLMGDDSLLDLHTWHKSKEFVAACDLLGVMRRHGDEVDLQGVEAALLGVAAKVRFIEAPLLEISSSDIRQRIAKGHPYRYYLTPAVYEIIRQQDLYS